MLKHGDLGGLYVLLARGVRPPPRTPHTPPLAAAQEPPGAPESLANGRLAHHRPSTRADWVAPAPSHRDGSVGGWGFAPTPNPKPPCLGGGLASIPVRC